MVNKPDTQSNKTEPSQENNALDSFLFYGKEGASMPQETSEKQTSWNFENETEDGDNRLSEFIKEKPRKVIDTTLLGVLSEEKLQEAPKKGRAKATVLKITALLLALALVLGAGYVYLTKDPKQYKKVNQSLTALVGNQEGVGEDGILKKYQALAEINPDMLGYIIIQDAEGNEAAASPVVGMGKTQEKYLNSHLFEGTKNRYGSVYTKSEITKEIDSDVIILKANAIDDVTGFSVIEEYGTQGYANKIPTLRFDTIYEQLEWAVFSAFSFKNGKEPFLMDREKFLNEKLFREYINDFYDNSQAAIDVDANSEDTLLVFLAEGKAQTYVLAARPLREGETAENLHKRKIIETSKPNEDKGSKDEQKNEDKEDKQTSSLSGVGSSTSSKPTGNKTNVPKIPTGMRYEQTGLTADMDKTAKVEMSNVVTLVDVIGQTKANALDILENTLGLKVKVEQVESAEKRGTVLKQSVAAEAQLSADVPITITISAGLANGKAKTPDLIGNSTVNAEILLEKAELTLGKVTEAESYLEAGTILSQSPKAGESVGYDTPVNLTISNGKGEVQTVKMPNLSGKTKDEAIALIKEAGLKVGKITTVTSSKTAGTVVGQECPKGEKIEQGSTVGFKISNGSKVNNLTVTNISSWSVTVNGKSYAPGDIIKGDYMDIIPYIVEAEMGGGFNIEALKAQAVAAYCWLINSGSEKGAAPGVPMKNPTDKAISAAEAVKGIKVKYGGETAQTYYYAIAADFSANCKDVWWADIAYLRAVPSEGDKHASGYKTTVKYSASELKSRVLDTYGIDLSGVNKSKWFSIKYDENNAYVREVNIGGKKKVTGSSMRDTLLQYELRSTAFKLKYDKSSDTFVFTVRGYGHGVGMSQVGANYYAGKGWDYERILSHYYPGTTLS